MLPTPPLERVTKDIEKLEKKIENAEKERINAIDQLNATTSEFEYKKAKDLLDSATQQLCDLREEKKNLIEERRDLEKSKNNMALLEKQYQALESQKSQKPSKYLYSAGPVDPKLNYSIPFDVLPWGKNLMDAVDGKQAILLHGHWQSGKTSALRFIKARAEDQGIKVFYLDMLAEWDALKLFLIEGRSIFQFLALRIGNLSLEYLPTFITCVDFCNWFKQNFQGGAILLIDEYDTFLKVGREDPRLLLEMNNLIAYNRNIQDTFSSIVCAGTFSIVASQTEDVGDMDIDEEAQLEERDSDDSLDALVRPFQVGSPWNKAHFIETQPFERQLFKEFAVGVYESHNANIEAEVVDDILETTCGHPGFSMWMLTKSIQQSIGMGCLTTAEWMNSKRSIYNMELYKTPTMAKMLGRVKSSKKIARVLHLLVRDNQVNCTEVRLVSFLRALGIAKPIYQDNFITFTSPIIRDCLLQQFYPACESINNVIFWEQIPVNFVQTVLLKALSHIKAAEILDPLVAYSKGLAEAAVHAELYRILHALFRKQLVTILTETRVVTSSDMRCDIWIKTPLAEFGLELKTECGNSYIQTEANPKIVKYASSREPREMVLVNFVMKEAASVTFPINITPTGWEKYPNTTFSVLFVKVMGDLDTGLNFCYASNGDPCWSGL